MSKRLAALDLVALGFKVFPVKAGAKAPPLLNGWPAKATADQAAVKSMWAAVPDANIAIHCKGLLVIDVDVRKGGADSLGFLRIMEDIPDTLTTLTPSGGKHLFYRLPEGHSGVPNSVEALGKGLDVRSTGGYVVAPGSTVPAGAYTFENPDVAIAAAPEWLVLKLGRVVPKAGTVATVLDASADTVIRASEWLLTAERSVKGQGGDQAAYRVACGLRDIGVSEVQAAELMRSAAWDYGCGWRDNWLEAKPIRSAYRYATGEPGAKTATVDDFEVVPPSPPRKRRGHRFGQSAAGNAPYLVKGVLSKKSYALMYGVPGSGKSFCALDIAYHVAAGKDWMGHKTRQGPVVYVPFEGEGGLWKREAALLKKYGSADIPMYVLPGTHNLRDPVGRRAFKEDIAGVVKDEFNGKAPALVIIDTLAYALRGGDENSAQDIGAFNTAVQDLIVQTGACVLVLHHPGKNTAAGARGSSALFGALDTELTVSSGQIEVSKQRDEDVGAPIGFKLVPVPVGMDEDGDIVTSCVVEEATARAAGVKPLTGNPKRGFDVLCELAPDNAPVSELRWGDACAEFLGTGRRQRLYEMKKALIARNLITIDNRGYISRRLE